MSNNVLAGSERQKKYDLYRDFDYIGDAVEINHEVYLCVGFGRGNYFYWSPIRKNILEPSLSKCQTHDSFKPISMLVRNANGLGHDEVSNEISAKFTSDSMIVRAVENYSNHCDLNFENYFIVYNINNIIGEFYVISKQNTIHHHEISETCEGSIGVRQELDQGFDSPSILFSLPISAKEAMLIDPENLISIKVGEIPNKVISFRGSLFLIPKNKMDSKLKMAGYNLYDRYRIVNNIIRSPDLVIN
jgi:hypothetical protein